MKKLISAVIGFWFLYMSIKGYIEGKIVGLGSMYVTSPKTTVELSPVYFHISILFYIAIGLYLLKISISSDDAD